MTHRYEGIILITMSKRLQVILDEAEFREIQHVAKHNRMTVSEWVRQVLRRARSDEPRPDVGQKLEAVRAAVGHQFPTGDIEEMLLDIEGGYLGPADS